jgi:hypothetical protein
MYTNYPDNISSTLYPITYRNEQSSADSLFVNVYIDSVNVGSFHADPAGVSTPPANFFYIDVMGFCAANVAPFVRSQSTIFGTLNDFYRSPNFIDCFKELYVVSYPETISSAGYLVTSSAADTSSATYIIPADLYGTSYSLNAFRQSSASDMYFLTSMRDTRKMRPTQNAFLSYLTLGIDSARFLFYSGTTSALGVTLDLVVNSSANSMQTFSVGLANILGQDTPGGSLVFHDAINGVFPLTADNYSYYTVSLGTYSGTYTKKSEALRFDIVPDCDDKIEIHWFGQHSGAESVVIEGGRIDATKVGGDLVDITPPWNVLGSPRRNSYDKSVIRTDTTVAPETRIQCAVTQSEAEYLATLFQSPEVYVVVGGQYVSCAIENGTFKRTDNRAVSVEVDFTIVYGQKVAAKI